MTAEHDEQLPKRPRADVPAHVKAAIERGLSPDPAARFASMGELLLALAPVRRTRPVTWLIGACSLAGVALAALAAERRMPPRLSCEPDASRVASIRSDARKGNVQRAFEATGAPYASTAFRETDAAFVEFRRAWISSYVNACEATKQRGEESERLLDLRMACLEQLRKEASALGAEFAREDRAFVDKAVDAVALLSQGPVACSASARRNATGMPASPSARQKVDAAGEELAAARVRLEARELVAARDHARTAITLANEARYPPIASEAGLIMAATPP